MRIEKQIYFYHFTAHLLTVFRYSSSILVKNYWMFQKNKDIFIESASFSAAAQAYRLTGNYVKALEYHRKAVALAEQTGNKTLVGFVT